MIRWKWIPFLSGAAVAGAVAGLWALRQNAESATQAPQPGPVSKSYPVSSTPPRSVASVSLPPGSEFKPKLGGGPLIRQTALFLHPGGSGDIAPGRVAGFVEWLEGLSAEELETACREALAGEMDEAAKEVFGYLLSRFVAVAPEKSLAFILTHYPEGLAAWCGDHPDRARNAFLAETGRTPLKAALETGRAVPAPWNQVMQTLALQELQSMAPQERQQFQNESVDRLRGVLSRLRSPEEPVRTSASKEAEELIETFSWAGQGSGSITTAVIRLRAERAQGATPAPPSADTDGVLKMLNSQSAGFPQAWDQDRQGVLSEIRAIPDAAERDGLIRWIAEHDAGKEAAELIKACHSNWSQTPALARSLEEWATTAPGDTASYVNEMPAGAMADACRLAVAGQWAQKDAAAALGFLLGAASSPERDGKVSQLYTEWKDFQPEKAAVWLGAQPPEIAALVKAAAGR
ncbi:MAG TPA: hypothetical protein VHM91_19385 [Verrucomicrobiales bacterium]|nr:hypothetical protein [Verrucomicrobiales bacterium]